MRRAAACVVSGWVLLGSAGAQTITTVAGNGTEGFCGDGGPAPTACLRFPHDVAVDAAGNLFIADTGNYRIRKVDAATGVITTVAGNGTWDAFCGDGGPATSACLNLPTGIAVDGAGVLYIADKLNCRVRKVDGTGTITTVAGRGCGSSEPLGDGGPATSAYVGQPADVAVDPSGALLITGQDEHRIRRVDASGTITTVAGTGDQGFRGDGGPAVAAALNYPIGLALDADGAFWFSDVHNYRIRQVDTAGIIRTVAGNGRFRDCDDGGRAVDACLGFNLSGVVVDQSGTLFLSTPIRAAVRAVDLAGGIATVAGGVYGYCGDGGPAVGACLAYPMGLAVDADGTLFIADRSNHRVRKVAGIPVPLALRPVVGHLQTDASNTLTGAGFTAGSVVRLFVATAAGPLAVGPFVPSSVSGTALSWTIPADVPLGNGFATVQVINTDQGYRESNVVAALLEGNPSSGVPTILFVNGAALGPAEIGIGVSHADTVVARGAVTTLVGTGFADPVVNLFTAAGNVGPLTPLAGWTTTSLQVTVPAGAPTGPGTFQVVNGSGGRVSNSVAAVIGAVPTITGIVVSGDGVTVTGTGFSPLSVVNLFNLQSGNAVNLGGLAGTAARIPLTVVSETALQFARPAAAVAGPAFLEVLNPPFVPFASSRDDPDGAFTFP